MRRFSELVVIEVGGSLSGAYCAKLFGDHGARVVALGRDEMTSAQRIAAARAAHPAIEVPGELRGRVDLVIRSAEDGPLPPLPAQLATQLGLAEATAADRPVVVEISPYGSDGPCASWLATDASIYAHAGHLVLTGDPAREPLTAPAGHRSYASGVFGFIGAVGALLDRERFGRHHDVEVSQHEVIVALHQLTLLRWQYGRDGLRRMGNRYTGQGEPNGLYRCRDGWIAVTCVTDPQVEMLCLVTGNADLLEHRLITSPMDFQQHPELMAEAMSPWFADQSMAEAAELLQSVRVPAAPARNLLGLLGDPHLRDRGFWQSRDGWTVPGPAYRFGTPTGSAAPLRPGDRARPLSGVRVLDLTRVWAGPLAARLLAELGAEVIQVEAPWNRGPRQVPESLVWAQRLYPEDTQGPNQWNRNGHLIKYGLSKKSVVLDLTRPAGIAAFDRLVARADVLMENFSPRVMPQLGLDEQHLHEINPGLVYTTMPGYGRSGPAKDWVAYGTTVDSHAGLSHLIGYPPDTPWKCGVAWPDPIAGLHATAATLVALWERPNDGGRTIEGAQFEATLTLIGDALVQAQMDGREATVRGNRDATRAPQGVYPCQGEDAWVAVSVATDASWRNVCTLLGLDEGWAALDQAERLSRHDEIDEELSRWTSTRPHRDAARELQAVGVAAGPALNAAEVLDDDQLRVRGALVPIDQPEAAPFVTASIPVRFSGAESWPPLAPAALLGEHNREVLATAGLSTAEIDELVATGITATEPPV